MAFKNLQDQNNKRKKIVERYKNRIPPPNMQDRKQQDINIIDTALRSLYNDGDKITRSLQEDILKPNQIRMTEKDTGRIWDIIINTGLVNAVIGFGNSGKLALSSEGYQLMSQFGSYSAFLEERDKQNHQGQNMMFPQFIIEQADDKEEKNENGGDGEKAVGKNNEAPGA